MKSKYTLNDYTVREFDKVFTSEGEYIFSSRCGKYWKTSDKIYVVMKDFDNFILRALEIQYRWCPIRDQFVFNFDIV